MLNGFEVPPVKDEEKKLASKVPWEIQTRLSALEGEKAKAEEERDAMAEELRAMIEDLNKTAVWLAFYCDVGYVCCL